MSTTNKSTANTPTTTVPDWDELPCVQYGFPANKGPARAPKLRTIFESVPDNAVTVSPIYGLTRDQYERQQRLESGYEVTGVYTSIATELQDECEADGRVLYPIHIESDAYLKEGPATLIEWFREFVEAYLDVPFHTCTVYFSGNRSIHVHVPRFVSGDDQREQFKEQAETFCRETGAELDCGIYSAKRLFRLPGVKHEKSGLWKVEIDPEWKHARIVRESNSGTPDIPTTYEQVLRHVFVSQKSLTVDSAQPQSYTPHDLFRILDSEKTVLEFSSDRQEIETPLIEQIQYPDDPKQVPTWAQYNAKEFSPYALASENSRSVAAIKVKGSAFARQDVRDGATLIPAYFYGARGCAGEEFTKADEHAPLQLSKVDYKKWNYEDRDHIVIIGGQSRNSRIIPVKSWDATVVGHALTGDGASRDVALDYLESEGYDIGKAGTSDTATTSGKGTRGRPKPHSRYTEETEAAKFQLRAERDGIRTLTHMERWRVACRLLWRGWEPAWEWFKEQYGPGFKPHITWEQFRSAVNSYPEDYAHVEVPPKPH